MSYLCDLVIENFELQLIVFLKLHFFNFAASLRFLLEWDYTHNNLKHNNLKRDNLRPKITSKPSSQ